MKRLNQTVEVKGPMEHLSPAHSITFWMGLGYTLIKVKVSEIIQLVSTKIIESFKLELVNPETQNLKTLKGWGLSARHLVNAGIEIKTLANLLSS